MGNLSNPGPSTATNGTAASITTIATHSVQLNPTIVTTLVTERIEGCHGSFTTIVVSASPTETSTFTGVTSSFTTSAASTTPLSHANHSTSATNTSPSTFAVTTSSPTLIIPGIYTDPSETHGSFSSSAGTIASSTAVPNREQGQEMPTGRKVGLAMIPIAVGLCAWAIVLLFLWRRRKIQKSHQRLMSISSRPEKNYSHLLPSLGSSFRASRVFTMTAFHIPDSESQRSRITSESLGGGVHALTCDSVGAPGKAPVTSPPRSTSSPGKKKAPSNPDSPIDEGSPFRLTREDTRRKSLGAEISHLWPSPPPSAWTKRQEILEQLPSSRFGRDMSLPRTQRLNRSSSQSPPRTARSIDKPAVGESWPLL